MWVAGVLASLSSINYPALSSLVSSIVGENKQGTEISADQCLKSKMVVYRSGPGNDYRCQGFM